MKKHSIYLSPAVFIQLKAIKREHGAEAGRLYNDIMECLSGLRDCPVTPGRDGKYKLKIGAYRVIYRKTEKGHEVLRIYKAAGA